MQKEQNTEESCMSRMFLCPLELYLYSLEWEITSGSLHWYILALLFSLSFSELRKISSGKGPSGKLEKSIIVN